MIIITSVGRTGTSFLAEYCKRIGLDIGQVNWIEEYRAGNECRDTVRINNILKTRILKGEKLLDEEIKNQIQAVEGDVVKDPQFLIYPDIITVWAKCRGDINVIFLTRDPNEIVASLKKVPFMNSPVFRNHADLIVQHEKAFLKKCKVLKINLAKFEYPYLLKNFKLVNTIIESMLGIKCKNETIWNQLVSQRPK